MEQQEHEHEQGRKRQLQRQPHDLCGNLDFEIVRDRLCGPVDFNLASRSNSPVASLQIWFCNTMASSVPVAKWISVCCGERNARELRAPLSETERGSQHSEPKASGVADSKAEKGKDEEEDSRSRQASPLNPPLSAKCPLTLEEVEMKWNSTSQCLRKNVKWIPRLGSCNLRRPHYHGMRKLHEATAAASSAE